MPAKPSRTSEKEQRLDNIPPEYRERFIEVVALTDEFCDRFLNDEYKRVCRDMAAEFCQEHSPVLRGKPSSWACGIAYSVARVNFLTDPSQTPHMKAEEIARGFQVSPATMHSKSRDIWNGLELLAFDPQFTVPSMMDKNPLIWILKVNGYLLDIREAPREAQVVAYEQGLIPYIPADRETEMALK